MHGRRRRYAVTAVAALCVGGGEWQPVAAAVAFAACGEDGNRVPRAQADDGSRWRRQRLQWLVAMQSVCGRQPRYDVTAVAASCTGSGRRLAATVCHDSGGGGVRGWRAAAGGDGMP